jgi:AcrR family transcriptional regulator
MTQPTHRQRRSDGQHTRNCLLEEALRLFAQHGFAGASTRAIALAAHANTASINYHFRDKAGLYRAALLERRFGSSEDDGLAHAWMRLWMREMLEPTGLRGDAAQLGIGPVFDAICGKLARDFPPCADQDDLARLAFTILFLPLPTMPQPSSATLAGYVDAIILSEKKRCAAILI